MLAYYGRGQGRGGGGKGSGTPLSADEERRRLRFPREGEVLGLVLGLMGGSRMKVACKDG